MNGVGLEPTATGLKVPTPFPLNPIITGRYEHHEAEGTVKGTPTNANTSYIDSIRAILTGLSKDEITRLLAAALAEVLAVKEQDEPQNQPKAHE